MRMYGGGMNLLCRRIVFRHVGFRFSKRYNNLMTTQNIMQQKMCRNIPYDPGNGYCRSISRLLFFLACRYIQRMLVDLCHASVQHFENNQKLKSNSKSMNSLCGYVLRI